MSYVEKLARSLLLLLNLAVVVVFTITLAGLLGYGMDNSDASAWNRSGLKLHTDYLTGCQYLQAPNGGLTPRLDATGGHICTANQNS